MGDKAASEKEEEKSEEEEKEKPKVRDIYAERRKKSQEDEPIVITPKELPQKPEEDGTVEIPKVCDPIEITEVGGKKDKVSDHFPEREAKTKEDEKIALEPKDIPVKGKKGARVRFIDQPGVVRRKKPDPELDEKD